MEISLPDEERIKAVDLLNGTSQDDEVIWAINYLLNLEDEEDLPMLAYSKRPERY